MHTLSLLIILLGPFLINQAVTQFIQLPLVKHPKTQKIKTNRLYQDLTCQVQGILMRNVTTSDMKPFPPCTSNPPELTLSEVDYSIYPTRRQRQSKILTTFQQIKYSQFQLDSFIDKQSPGQHIYIMLRTGQILIYERSKQSHMMILNKSITVNLPTQGELLEVGYFIKMGSQGPILFINDKYCIKVTLNQATILEGYTPAEEYDNFETVLAIEDGHFIVVASQRKGICVYQYDHEESRLLMALHMGKEELFGEERKNELQISDLAYDEQNKQLLILDLAEGVYRVNMIMEMQQNQNSQQSQDNGFINGIKLSWQQLTLIHQQRLCDIIYFDPGTRNHYVACTNHILRQSIDDPANKYELLPHPEIKVREIEATDRMIVYTGRNVFKMYDIMDRNFVHYYQEFIKINKVHLVMDTQFQGRFYFTNQHMLIEGFFNIDSPYITCKTDDKDYMGKQSQITITSIGPCDKNYIEKFYKKWYIQQNGNSNGFNSKSLNQQNICVYKIQQTLYFWLPGEINTHALLIGVIICLILGVVVFGVWCVFRLRVNRLALMLEQYQCLEEQSTHSVPSGNKEEKHQQLVEQDDGTGDRKGNQQSEMQFGPNKKKDNDELVNQQHYDIE